MKSMTGFGRSKLEENSREYIVEIKSVNHKYSDISIKMPRSISCFEENVKKIVLGILLAIFVSFLIFMIYTSIGSLIWNIVLCSLGKMVGNNYMIVANIFSKYSKLILFLLISYIIFRVIKLIVKKYKKVGTNSIPPPVEKNPLINPAIIPITMLFFITSSLPHSVSIMIIYYSY